MYNILIIGATGVGKSTLLNKIANQNIANIGFGATPETKELDKYILNSSITIWDSPGLGEALKKDKGYKKNLKQFIRQDSMIDYILIVLDIKNKSIQTTTSLIKTILKIDNKLSDKFIFILNKVDEAKNYRYWNHKENIPSQIQIEEIKAKIYDYKKRIEEKTNININLFLNCSSETGYNVTTITDTLYTFMLQNHFLER